MNILKLFHLHKKTGKRSILLFQVLLQTLYRSASCKQGLFLRKILRPVLFLQQHQKRISAFLHLPTGTFAIASRKELFFRKLPIRCSIYSSESE
ncbi:hypothetical protein D3C80_859540 [compost metagenome]